MHISKTMKWTLCIALSTNMAINAGFLDLLKLFLIVKQEEQVIIERLGRFSRTLGSGIQFKIPILEAFRKVNWSGLYETNKGITRYRYSTNRIDLRERVYDLPSQSVITKDNVAMKINALIYYKIEDPKKAVYSIDDLPLGIEKLAQTSLRNIIGSITLDATLVSRDTINDRLCSNLDGATDQWGVAITRVELQEVTPPESILHAMERQMTAERNRRAEITDAEGKKSADILRSEGERASRILFAEGEAESILRIAEAQQEAINKLRVALGGSPASYILASDYIKALPKITEGKNTKLVVVPYETNALAGMLAAMKQIAQESK